MLKVLRNVSLGALLSLFFAFVFGRGNIFVPLGQQVFLEFITANSVWFIVGYITLMILHLSTSLMDETFTVNPELTKSKKFIMCCRKLARKLMLHCAIACSSTSAFVYFVSMKIPAYKLGMYFTGLSASYITIWADIYARQIIRNETLRGERDLAERQRRGRASQPNPGDTDFSQRPLAEASTRGHHVRHQNNRRRHRKSIPLKFILRIALIDTPLVVTSAISIVYVHIIIVLLDITQQWQFAIFTICSTLLKLGVQEAMKAAMMKQRRIPPKRLMMALIATPTILIETQLRIYQLRLGSNTIKVLSVIVLAIVEIAIRIAKLFAIQRELGTRVMSSTIQVVDKSRQPKQSVMMRKQLTYMGARVLSPIARANSHGPRPPASAAADYKTKLLVFHTAETYADMYAEYVALGCSYAMFVTFSEHPFFNFHAASDDTKYSGTAYWLILLLQISIEIAIDIVACMLEILLGVRFEDFDQNDWFTTMHMIIMAFDNIGMVAGLYVNS